MGLDKETTIRLLKDHTCNKCRFVEFEQLPSPPAGPNGVIPDGLSYRIICSLSKSSLPVLRSCNEFEKLLTDSNSLWNLLIANV
jgi:hypothetical protein